MKIKVWGARGSRIVSNDYVKEYGGNTSCVEININGNNIFFDSGSGIITAGDSIRNKKTNKFHIFLSHYHLDHINGLPFFQPLYQSENTIEMYGSNYENMDIETILNNYIRPPYAPFNFNSFPAKIKLNSISENQEILIDDIRVNTINSIHPDGGLYYKLSHGYKVFSYITDIELREPIPQNLIDFVKDSDLLLFDSMYTEDEYNEQNKKVGWGHSTWERAITLAKVSNVKKLLLFHHSPSRTDKELHSIEINAKKIFSNTLVAKEGMEIIL